MSTRTFKKRGLHIHINEKGLFYAQVVARNGHILLQTTDDYTDKRNAVKALNAALKELSVAARGFELDEELQITIKNCNDHTK